MAENPEIDQFQLEYKAPGKGESYSKLPLNNTRALIRMALGDEAALRHHRSLESAARMSSRTAPDIGVN